jgi:hypothetical protein
VRKRWSGLHAFTQARQLRPFHAQGIGNKPTAAKVLLEGTPKQPVDHGIVEVSDFDALCRAYDIQRFGYSSDHVGGSGFRCVHNNGDERH